MFKRYLNTVIIPSICSYSHMNRQHTFHCCTWLYWGVHPLPNTQHLSNSVGRTVGAVLSIVHNDMNTQFLQLTVHLGLQSAFCMFFFYFNYITSLCSLLCCLLLLSQVQFLQYYTNTLAGKNVSENDLLCVTCIAWNLNSVNQQWTVHDTHFVREEQVITVAVAADGDDDEVGRDSSSTVASDNVLPAT